MGVVLRISDAHKAYADQVLFDGAELTLTDDMKVGVVGRNGAGKSTLCRAILNEEALDSGSIDPAPDLRIAYLQQHDPWTPEDTVLAFLERHTGQPDFRCGQVCGRFALKGPTLEAPISSLSGGWQTRVKLAAMLLQDPDLLILDEPTNFLDLRTQLLLEHFLADWRGAALIVSHDRTFLGRTCTHTCEVARGKLSLFAGGVEAYYERLAEERQRLEQANAAIAAKRKQLQTFIDKHRANANTASQAKSKGKQLERLELHELDEGPGATTRIAVPEVTVRDGTAYRCQDLAIGYGTTAIATDIDLEIERGSRVAVVGDNGQGKTTLVRTLGGSLPALAGTSTWTHGADLGIYGQHVFGTLPEDRTVLEFLTTQAPSGTTNQELLAMAGSFLFRGDAVHKSISVLSGGERARLVLAGMLLHRHTVLVLDEPTNHLDVETIEALAAALTRYQGTVLVVSHDRRFVEHIATDVIEVRDGGVASYPGDFATYCYRVEQELDAGERATSTVTSARPAQVVDDEAARAERKARARRRHELEKQIKSLERKIAQLEERIADNDQALANAASSAHGSEILATAAKLRGDLAASEESWLQAQAELDALTQESS